MSSNSSHDKKVPPKRKAFLAALLLAICASWPLGAATAATIPAATLESLQEVYSQEELLHYEISWLGIPAGELIIQLLPDQDGQDRYTIRVTAKSAGLLDVFYPVEDNFETIVSGPARLPTRYRFDQREGRRRNTKLTTYDQAEGIVTYRKNDAAMVTYTVSGPVHNEFASFMIMRALPMVVGTQLMVPTFADEKRHEVMVQVETKEKIQSIFGEITAIRVRPQLPFKGLYKKTGDPVVWISDDQARIPLTIKAKIVIGSLTA
ncbi:MAG: DUF3108 domain-containing protein, partial [Desulfobulbaceae bacterium]|nr:DUF3108 domain-containing protein [Desulfobulbaceae bacterium]